MPRPDRVKKVTPAKARPGGTETGRMNLTEKRFEQNILWPAQLAGEVVAWRYESIKFRLADRTWYTPDFVVQMADGTLECVDVKGSAGWEQHTRIKMKVVAEQFPEYTWAGYTETRGRLGEFKREEF